MTAAALTLVSGYAADRLLGDPASTSFPGLNERYIRIAVRTRDDNALLVNALTDIPV
jgi:hypothetical protein